MPKKSAASLESPKNRTSHWVRVVLAPVLAVVIIAVLVGTLFWHFFVRNYAQETAQPFENVLIAAGGVKECTSGDQGRGPDNAVPGYTATYDVPVDGNRALSLVQDAAIQNGFNLQHATPSNKGWLAGVADVYIDHYYFDSTKKSPYSDLQAGPIDLDVTIVKSGETDSCKRAIIAPGHTVIGVGVQLPEFKR